MHFVPPSVAEAPTVADRILAALRAKGAAMSPREVHRAVGGSYDTVRSTLISMRDRGDLEQPTRGAYALPAPPGVSTEAPPRAQPPPGASITDLLDDPEARPAHGLVRVAGHFVAKGYDDDGLMYAVEIAFHVRPEPRVTRHATGLTRAGTAPARPGRAASAAT